MAGIYIHIPFCKQRCNYCNFHFSTNKSYIQDFVAALLVEISLQANYLNKAPIRTVYFGGGTPSLLDSTTISAILNALQQTFLFEQNQLVECTFEVNPEDITPEYLSKLKHLGITRLSIGIQSFKEKDLEFMHRSHSMTQSTKAIEMAVDAGFKNISIDLIYGTPGLSNEDWIAHIDQAAKYDINHISAYALTVEPKTMLEHQILQQKTPALDEEQAANQFEILVKRLQDHGFEQYEISNFAKDKQYAAHNTSYWKNEHYLGFGPSAHSFNGHSRQWNIANNALYINNLIKHKQLSFEIDILTPSAKWNDYILTALRTKWGLNSKVLQEQFPAALWDTIQPILKKYIEIGYLTTPDANTYTLSTQGKLFADDIASNLMIVNS